MLDVSETAVKIYSWSHFWTRFLIKTLKYLISDNIFGLAGYVLYFYTQRFTSRMNDAGIWLRTLEFTNPFQESLESTHVSFHTLKVEIEYTRAENLLWNWLNLHSISCFNFGDENLSYLWAEVHLTLDVFAWNKQNEKSLMEANQRSPNSSSSLVQSHECSKENIWYYTMERCCSSLNRIVVRSFIVSVPKKAFSKSTSHWNESMFLQM